MKKILIALAVVLVVCVAGVLVTAVDQLVGLAGRFHPLAGQITFWILVSAIAGAALFILFEYYRLPVTLALPADASPGEQRRYLSLLRRRLKSNPRPSRSRHRRRKNASATEFPVSVSMKAAGKLRAAAKEKPPQAIPRCNHAS